jgi:hypothetical protein
MKLLPLIALLLTSCMVADEKRVVTLGGKVAYNGRNFSVVSDHEDSFRSGAALAGIAAGIYGGIRADSIAAGVSTNAANNAAKVNLQTIKSNEAISLGEQALKAKTFIPPP